jgi:hypothetical protein
VNPRAGSESLRERADKPNYEGLYSAFLRRIFGHTGAGLPWRIPLIFNNLQLRRRKSEFGFILVYG